MKAENFIVVTADQRRSRHSSDRVPEALSALHSLDTALAFERTAGDEIQGLLSSAQAAVSAIALLSELGDWRIGLGVGTVETPLPTSTRAARGPAYLAAREAIERAASVPAQLRLVESLDSPSSTASNSAASSSAPSSSAQAAETVLWLLRALWSRRTPEGWEVATMLEQGRSAAEIAVELQISPSAVSQRQARAHVIEERRGHELAVELLRECGLR